MATRCSAESQDGRLVVEPVCVGCAGFVPDGLSRDKKRMWKPVLVVKAPATSVGARRRHSPPVFDGLGRQFGGNWPAVEAAAKINQADKNLPDAAEVAGFGFLGNER